MTDIFGYRFSEPYPLGTEFTDVPCVYAVYTNKKWLDVGETDKLGSRINNDNHERKPCWIANAEGKNIWIIFLIESDQQKRLNIEADLRSKMNPTCGEK